MMPVTGVNTYGAMAELLKAQAKQLGELMQTAVDKDVELARKLATVSAKVQIESAKQEVIGQVLDMYM